MDGNGPYVRTSLQTVATALRTENDGDGCSPETGCHPRSAHQRVTPGADAEGESLRDYARGGRLLLGTYADRDQVLSPRHVGRSLVAQCRQMPCGACAYPKQFWTHEVVGRRGSGGPDRDSASIDHGETVTLAVSPTHVADVVADVAIGSRVVTKLRPRCAAQGHATPTFDWILHWPQPASGGSRLCVTYPPPHGDVVPSPTRSSPLISRTQKSIDVSAQTWTPPKLACLLAKTYSLRGIPPAGRIKTYMHQQRKHRGIPAPD